MARHERVAAGLWRHRAGCLRVVTEVARPLADLLLVQARICPWLTREAHYLAVGTQFAHALGVRPIDCAVGPFVGKPLRNRRDALEGTVLYAALPRAAWDAVIGQVAEPAAHVVQGPLRDHDAPVRCPHLVESVNLGLEVGAHRRWRPLGIELLRDLRAQGGDVAKLVGATPGCFDGGPGLARRRAVVLLELGVQALADVLAGDARSLAHVSPRRFHALNLGHARPAVERAD